MSQASFIPDSLLDLTSHSYNDLDDKPTIPTALSALSDDTTHRLVTDTLISTWNGKQAALGYTPLNETFLGIGSLADPGANKLMLWDDTDNALKFAIIGTGLSYDHATYTLSATGAAQTPWTSNINAATYNITTLGGGCTLTGNGALSSPGFTMSGTWITGGTTTTTKPYFLIEPAGTTSATWSTSGTGFGLNAASGFTGNPMDLKINNASVFKVDQYGYAYVGTNGTFYAGYGPNVKVAAAYFYLKDASGSTLTFVPNNNTAATNVFTFGDTSSYQYTNTSGTSDYFTIFAAYNQTSGTATNTVFKVNMRAVAVGSGTQRIASLGTGGASYVEKWGLDMYGIPQFSPSDYAGTPVAPTAPVKVFAHNKSVADDGIVTLPAITTNAYGIVTVGTGAAIYACFLVDSTGTVVLLTDKTADVVANADTDTKLCIGTAATQEPLVVKNRLGSTQVINVVLWYD